MPFYSQSIQNIFLIVETDSIAKLYGITLFKRRTVILMILDGEEFVSNCTFQ